MFPMGVLNKCCASKIKLSKQMLAIEIKQENSFRCFQANIYIFQPAPVAVSYSGCRNVQGAEVPCALPSLVPAAAGDVVAVPAEPTETKRKRRSAEAEAEADPEAVPEADPWLYYSHVPAYPYHFAPPVYTPYHFPAPLHYLHSYYSSVGCKNYLGATVPCA